MKGRIMPKSKQSSRKRGTKPAANVIIPAAKPGFDPSLLKREARDRSQRFGRGKPPRFPGRTGGR
jgi:hypothetical protein